MKMKFRKNWWIWLIVGVLCCAMLGGIIYAIVAATENKEKTVEISASEFSLGGLDDNGKYVETKESIYTKDAFECKGLTVTPEFESQVTYQIYFYDSLGEFLYKTEVLEKAFRDEVDITATHARIVITPNEDEDGNAVTMNVFNKSKYAKQLTITVNENQNTYPKTYSLDMSRVTLIKGIMSTGSSDDLIKLRANDDTTKSYLIDLSLYSEHYDVVTLKNESKYTMWYGFLTEEPTIGEEISFSVGHSQESSSDVSVDLHIPTDAKYLCVRYSVTDVVCGPSAIILSRI